MTERPLALAVAALVALLALGAAPAGAQPTPDDRAKAEASFKQGQAYFQRGDYDRAIAEYQAAFELSAEPSLLFNIALCHDRASRPEEALQGYRRYLELVPDGTVADEARDEIARLTPIVDQLAAERAARAAAEEARQREEAARRAPPPPPPPGPSRVPLYVVVAGAAVAAAGATAHVLAWRTRGRLEDAPGPDAYFADRDTFELQRGVAVAGYAAGAVTIATGLILGVTVFRGREAPQISAALAPGGAMVAVGWSR